GGDSRYIPGNDPVGPGIPRRLFHGARTSPFIGVGAGTSATGFGATAGLIAGYVRGWAGTGIKRPADVQLAFPFILLALAILSVTEVKSALTIIIVLAIADWVIHARIVRGRVLVEREKEYVRSAKALGASDLRIMFLYVLPAVLPTAI